MPDFNCMRKNYLCVIIVITTEDVTSAITAITGITVATGIISAVSADF